MDICIVDTRTANTASVVAWLQRAGVSPRTTTSADDVLNAEAIVLPGVGAFGAAMSELNERRLAEPLRARLQSERSFLGICLGMQLLFAASEESPGVSGLGVVSSSISRLSDAVRVPHMGWNAVTPERGSSLLQQGYAYFANSYAATAAPTGWVSARTSHGGFFISAIERGSMLACQFHPELSGAYGASLLSRWLAAARAQQEARTC